MNQTLFRPGENCCAVAHANRAAMLVDGEEYFGAFVKAAERAERSILIMAWDFDSRMTLRYDENNQPLETLGDFLNRLCREKPKLRIRILDWDFPMVYGTDREYSPIFGLPWDKHRHIDFQFDDTHPLAGSHHQKIVVFDDKVAFAGGLDLTNKRWDSPKHAPGDPRRTFEEEPYPPFHDVMLAVDDEAARELATIARNRWLKATRQKLKPVETRSDPWPEGHEPDFEDVNVSIACTRPPVNGDPAIKHIESLYVDMIRAARDYIYIENQYFTSEKVGDALEARLGQPDGPQIVLVTRLLSHGWLEEKTMHVLRNRLVRRLRDADKHGKFHAYYPHVEGLCEGTCLDLHSKVMIVDDEWLRVGSSNISNRSMGVDTECDVTIEAQGDERDRAVVRHSRDRLIAEHCGVTVEAFQAELERSGTISAAVAKLGSPGRHLRKLEAPEVSEALLAAASIGDMEKPISLDALVDGFASDRPGKASKKRPFAIVGAVAAIASLALIWRYTPLANVVTSENVIAFTESFAQYWWAPLLLMLAYTPASMIMFPRPLITMAIVVTFGPWEGLVYAMSGVLLAAALGYMLGRLVNRGRVRRIAGPRLNRISQVLQHRGIIAVALVRFVPIAPYQVVNIVMGAMRVKLRDFLVGTFLGMLPGALAATVLSDQVAAALRDPAKINGWLIAAAVCGFAALAYFGHRMLDRMGRNHPHDGPPHSFA
ncbi:MAG TPA: VTT domain-containing protein [Usitatibacter sp.]|nr:VTT domain-containing protein [Usitatibacter sp.]